MVERVSMKVGGGGGAYFASPRTNIEFIGSGCRMLDLALGGGWAESRIGNIIGDKSTGKTLLCIEASANFVRKYRRVFPKIKVRYRESEHAFDESYAEAIGMPLDYVDFGQRPLETVEDLFEDLTECVNRAGRDRIPELYICDSLDALSDRAELKRAVDKGSFGAEKAKKMGQLFRRLVGPMEASRVTLLIVSQVRDKIGVTFGRKWTRSGGRALDFYASQVLYLAQLGKLYKTINKMKRPIGIEVRAKLDKNKVGLPYREAEFPILFGYGIDDAKASVNWLKEIGKVREIGAIATANTTLLTPQQRGLLDAKVGQHWYAIERASIPTRAKYSDLMKD